MWIGAVRLAYEAVWNTFVSACEQSGSVVKPRAFTEAIHCENPSVKGKPHQIDSLFYLPELRFRGADTSEKVDVLVRANETVSFDWRAIESSRVTIAYLEVKQEGVQLLQSIHYDFEGKIQRAHPWFHAQLGVDYFDPQERKRVGCRHDISRDYCRPVKSLRIATAHMGLSGVLLGLAADHLNNSTFDIFIRKAKEQATNFPAARFASMQKRLQKNPGQFTNLHWFEEAN
jgi:hypothetical protein